MRIGKPDGHVTGQEQESLAAGFGARLKELREAAGLSRLRLATSAGVAQMTVYCLENGRRRPGEVTLAAMAAILSPQNPESVVSELAALAGGSMRRGWKRPGAPAKQGLTVKQARQALGQARADHEMAQRIRRFRPNAGTEGRLAKAAAAVRSAELDLQRAESLADVATTARNSEGSLMSAD